MRYDIAVIGGGPGGYRCAISASRYGLKTVLIEKDELGGTCLNRGCIPTKTILYAGHIMRLAHQAKDYGVNVTVADVDYEALRNRCRKVIEQLREGMARQLKQSGVEVLRGSGRVIAPQHVLIKDTAGRETDLEAEDIVLAAGSRPSVPSIPGADLPGVYNSDTLLARIPAVSSITIIGGGVIGVEFAEAYNAFGARVTIIEAEERILPPFDRELSRHLSAGFKKRGISIITGARIERIEEGFACTYEAGGKTATVMSEAILIATGRRADMHGLCEASCMPAVLQGRIVVDENGSTSLPHLYAIGDIAAGRPQLAHAASAEGASVAAYLAGKPKATDLSLVPECVYTSPEIAQVGLSETATKERFQEVTTGKFMMRANGKSLLTGQDGYIKLIADGQGVLRGAQLFCENATDLIGEAALAIRLGLTAEAFAGQIRAHPTLEEALGDAAEALVGRSA